MKSRVSLRSFIQCAIAASLLASVAGSIIAQEKEAPVFSSTTIDLGVVVADIEKSADFYTKVLGFTEVKGFTATAEKATAFGLTDNREAVIRVFTPADQPGSAKLKLMSFPEAKPARPDQKFIHSTLGVSYLTLRVADMDAAVARLKKAGIQLKGETPSSLGGNTYLTTVQDPDGNFIELIGPMKK